MRFALVVSAVLGCARAETAEDTKQPKPLPVPSIGIELAGVTLADDCGPNVKPMPPPAQPSAGSGRVPAASQDAPDASMAAGACATPGGCHIPAPQCEQSSMQIAIKANGQKTKIAIKRVELLDSSGKVVGELTASTPTQWSGSAYVTWDEAVAGDLNASYKLTSPDWEKLTKGRWNAANFRFQLRVIVTVGDKERAIEKQSITPALPEPEVVT
jgi:hypothetical protein